MPLPNLLLAIWKNNFLSELVSIVKVRPNSSREHCCRCGFLRSLAGSFCHVTSSRTFETWHAPNWCDNVGLFFQPHIYKNLEFGVDLDARVALVGPNGAGKSTLLKLIAGEVRMVPAAVLPQILRNISG